MGKYFLSYISLHSAQVPCMLVWRLRGKTNFRNIKVEQQAAKNSLQDSRSFISSLHLRIIAKREKSDRKRIDESTFYIWRIALLGAQSTMLHLLFPLSAQELHFISSIFNLARRQRAKKKKVHNAICRIEQYPLKDVRRNSHYQLVSLAFFAFIVSYLVSYSPPSVSLLLVIHRGRIICCWNNNKQMVLRRRHSDKICCESLKIVERSETLSSLPRCM